MKVILLAGGSGTRLYPAILYEACPRDLASHTGPDIIAVGA